MRKRFILAAALLGAGLVWPPELCADDKPEPHRIPHGKGEIHLHLGEVKLKVFTCRPKDFDPKHGPMLWTFHGQARDPERYRDAAEAVAGHCKGIVLAPLFDEKQFPGRKYMHGNVLAKGKALPESEWTLSLVPRMIEAVRKLEDRPNMPYYLFGHSGGGQFVMRLMAFVELEPVEAVAANPGSLLFPTIDLPYPYGFGQLPRELGGEKRIKAFLAARLTLYSGTADTDPKHRELDRSAEAEKQGPHRLALMVRLGLWGLPTRGAAWAFFWLSIAAAAGCVAYSFVDWRFSIGGLLVFAALWYFLSIRWVDEHSSWS